MSTRIHRFDFNSLRDFRGPIVINTVEEAQIEDAAPVIVAPVFTEQDMESARATGKKQGYNEGFSAGQLEARKEADSKTEAATAIVIQLRDSVASLNKQYQQLLVSESANLSGLITSIARKVAGDAMNEHGIQAITAIVERCLPVIFSKPRLIIELNPDVFQNGLERLETMLQTNGFEGEVQFKSNPNFGPSDVALDWGSGQVNRSAETLWQEIDALIARVPLELAFAETLDTQTKPTGE